MLKIRSILSITVHGREYEFTCPPDSPINDALDANNQMNAFLLGRAEQAKNPPKMPDMPPLPEVPEMPPMDLPVTDEVKQG